jgi:predicted metal-dependent RNase
MDKVEKKIRVHKDGKVVEATALFYTGSRRSYFSKDFAERIGFDKNAEKFKLKVAFKIEGEKWGEN